MPLNNSDIAAWWGAIVATAVFGLEIYKYTTAKPKLVILTEKYIGKHSRLIIEIANLGNQTTTLNKIYVSPGIAVNEDFDRDRKWTRTDNFKVLASTDDRFALPYKVAPGEAWHGWIEPKLVDWIVDMETIDIKVIDIRGGKIQHETEVPPHWKA